MAASTVKRRSSANRSYYDVPYAERGVAKAMGARWDPRQKHWYAPTPAVSDAMAERWEPAYLPDPNDGIYAAAGATRRYWHMSAHL